jgi:hypothetical protein
MVCGLRIPNLPGEPFPLSRVIVEDGPAPAKDRM